MIVKLLLLAALLYGFWRMAVAAMKPAMPRDEAAKLLGIDATAQRDVVVDAHRRLIARVHPDAGGSAELAARINRARDVMLKP